MKTTFSKCDLNSKKIRILSSVSLLLLLAFMPGCPAGNQTANSPSPERIVIKGSNTIGEELAPRLIAEYKKEHPTVMIDLETRGTGSGFYGIFAAACDIAAASRGPLTNEQAQAQSRNIQLNDAVIGSYAVAVVVNASNPVTNLTSNQVRDLFTGNLKNWHEVGGPDAPVHLYIRDPISGTYLGFRELAMENKPYATNTTAFTNYSGIVQAVAGDTNGIGYSGIQSTDNSGAKALSIGGVTPAAASVNEGKYPFSRVLHFFTNKGAEAPLAHDFVQFVQSPHGQEILAQMGFVPRP